MLLLIDLVRSAFSWTYIKAYGSGREVLLWQLASLICLVIHFYPLAKQVKPGQYVCLEMCHDDCLVLKNGPVPRR